MKKLYFLYLLALLTLTPRANASHIYGGDLLYQHISGNTYRVMVVLYGDCGSISQGLFDSLMYAHPELQIADGQTGGLYMSLDLPIDSSQSNIDVTPVCPDSIGHTRCNSPFSTLPGIKKFVYYDTITLPHTSPQWKFIFNGNLYLNPNNPQQTIQAGRTQSITNIVFSMSSRQVMYLVATLNNMNGGNSSPVYTTVPTPFYCINIPQQYNQGASDPDADSLSFALVPGLTDGSPIFYQPPYTGAMPLATSNFSYNEINGQMAFTPNLLQKSLVVNEVREYKNGVLVGSSMREMSFIVLDNCMNEPPLGNLATNGSNFTGGIHDGNNVINVCDGEPLVSFDIAPTDPNAADSLILYTYNVPTGATLNIQNNGSPNPLVHFNWNISSVPAGIYNFYINYKDDGCPLSSNQTIAYTVQIAKNYSITADILSETNCFHRAAVQYNVSGGVIPRTITVMQGSSVVKTLYDSTGTVPDSLAAGSYTIKVSSPYFACDTSINIVINESGTYPIRPSIDNSLSFCIGDDVLPLPVSGTGILQWYDANGSPLQSAPVYNTNNAGQYTWYVSQQVGACISDTIGIHVRINNNPQTEILSKGGKVCYADVVYLVAAGGQSYKWLPAEKVLKDVEGKEYAFVKEPGIYTVICTDENGCKDTSDISFTEIEQCCQFGYPNAFTPNGDGKNDKFRPVMHGNMEEYELRVFNRFGEVVFYSQDAKQGWDGRYKGQLCDVGMYYFKVKAKCYTGQTEEHSNAVDLLR